MSVLDSFGSPPRELPERGGGEKKKKTTQNFKRKSGKLTGSGTKGRVTQQEQLPGSTKNDSAVYRERRICWKLNHASREAHVVGETDAQNVREEEKGTISLNNI